MRCLACYDCDYECLLGAYGVVVGGLCPDFFIDCFAGVRQASYVFHGRKHVR
jgi:hypothetical protein